MLTNNKRQFPISGKSAKLKANKKLKSRAYVYFIDSKSRINNFNNRNLANFPVNTLKNYQKSIAKRVITSKNADLTNWKIKKLAITKTTPFVTVKNNLLPAVIVKPFHVILGSEKGKIFPFFLSSQYQFTSILTSVNIDKNKYEKELPNQFDILSFSDWRKITGKGSISFLVYCDNFKKRENLTYNVFELSEIEKGKNFISGTPEKLTAKRTNRNRTTKEITSTDYSKREIREILLSLGINDKVKLSELTRSIFNQVTSNYSEPSEKDIDGKIFTRNFKFNGKINGYKKSKTYTQIDNAINFVIFLNKGYKRSFHDQELSDLRQDLSLYWLQRQSELCKVYRIKAKAYNEQTQKHFKFKTFLIRRFSSYVQYRVDSYLYPLTVPARIKSEMKKNNVVTQISSIEKNNAFNTLIAETSEKYTAELTTDTLIEALHCDITNKLTPLQKNIFNMKLYNFKTVDIMDRLDLTRKQYRTQAVKINNIVKSPELMSIHNYRTEKAFYGLTPRN